MLAGAFKSSVNDDAEPIVTVGWQFNGHGSAEAWMAE